jgi:hypothetical protein
VDNLPVQMLYNCPGCGNLIIFALRIALSFGDSYRIKISELKIIVGEEIGGRPYELRRSKCSFPWLVNA